MKIKDILIAARELIADPSRWTTGELARNGIGRRATPYSIGATCFCAIGAIHHSLKDVGAADWHVCLDRATDDLYASSMHLHGRDPAFVNDKLGHEAVLKVYDLAIANCGD